MLTGKQLQRYRLRKCLSRQLKFLPTRKDRSLKCLQKRQQLTFWKEWERRVKSFLERTDTSRINLGKQNCLTVDGEKVQTKILNDYLNILQKIPCLKSTILDERHRKPTVEHFLPHHQLHFTRDSANLDPG